MAYGMKVELDDDNGAVIATIVDRDNNNQKVAERSFDASTIHESLRTKVALYGVSKLIQDRTSDKSVKEHGEGKLDYMDAVLARLASGEWAAERKAGAPTVSAEIEAIAQLKGATVAEIQATLRTFTKEQKAGIFANEKVKTLAAEIKAARTSAAPIDMSDLA